MSICAGELSDRIKAVMLALTGRVLVEESTRSEIGAVLVTGGARIGLNSKRDAVAREEHR